MANRYWVGGTASWDGTAGTKWAATSGGTGGETVPTTADDVFFDNAVAGSNGTVTIATGNTGAKSITCTGFIGTLTGTASITVAGSVTLVAGMTYSHTGTVTITDTGTVTTAGKAFSNLTVNGAGITVTLGDALNLATRILTVTQGTFDTGNFNVTASTLNSGGTSTRTINLGSSTVTLSAAGPVGVTGSNFTFNAGTSTLNLSNSSVAFGADLTYYDVNITSTAAGIRSIVGTNTFNNLSITAPSSGIISATISADQTINGTLTCAGASPIRRIFVNGIAIGNTRTLTVGTLSATDCDFRDITIAGTAAGSSPTRAGDCGGNSGITFPAAKTVYWNLAAGGNWSATGWAASSGDSPDVNNFPLAQDTAIVEATGLNSGSTLTIDASWNIGSVDLSARTSNTVTITNANSPVVYGNWTNGTGVSFSGTGTFNFSKRGSQTITSAGRTFTQSIVIDAPSGTVSLLDALITNRSAAGALTLSRGTFDAASYNVTLSGTSSGFNGNTTTTRTLAIGSGTWTVAGGGTSAWTTAQTTGLTITGIGVISLTSGVTKSFAGGGGNYGGITLNNGGSGALVITGSNTIGTLSNSVQPTTFTFTAGTTTTITNWNINGTAGSLVTIRSATAATHTLSKASGTVSADYLSITNSTATGGATWYAGANSTNVSGNTGWIFTAPPAPGATATNFLIMF